MNKLWNRVIVTMIVVSALLIMIQNNVGFASSLTIQNIEEMELLVKKKNLSKELTYKEIEVLKDRYEDEASKYYIEGVWSAVQRDYEEATSKFESALLLLEKNPNSELEMYILEKILEIEGLYGRFSNYQDHAIRLKKLSFDKSDQLYIKSLFAMAEAHFHNYNDDVMLTYLDAGYNEAIEFQFSNGISRYYELKGDLERSYGNYSLAEMHYIKSYEEFTKGDKILSYKRDLFLKSKLAKNYRLAGSFDESLNIYKQLEKIIDLESDYFVRDYYFEYGLLLSSIGEWEIAIEKFTVALEKEKLLENNDVHKLEASIYMEFGYGFTALEKYKEAALYFKKSYDVSRNMEFDKTFSEKVSTLTNYEASVLEGELTFRQKLRDASTRTIQLQKKYLRLGIFLVFCLFVSLFVLLYINRQKERIRRDLQYELEIDHLTQIYNRGKIIEVLEDNLVSSSFILMMDIDNFKSINDTFGHVVGDKALIRIAQVIKENLSDGDSVGRYGGEEFLVIINNTSSEKSFLVAEQIRLGIEHIEWEEDIMTTISIGMVQSNKMNSDELLSKADFLMYEAKNSGKNRVVF